ncbi:MAG: hypothetical protein Q9159_005677 [Coniocarpon cinnabarinum]
MPDTSANIILKSSKVPRTGVTRYYDFDIARGTLSPDGYEKEGMLVNGQFPGPPIEACLGDMITVNVHNSIQNPEEGAAIHWHGLSQYATQSQDGVPGISQCPIAPGDNFTYTFQADKYGSSWWHSHYSASYADGVVGAIIIHGPEQIPYDVDVGPILLGDYYHDNYYDLVEMVVGNNSDFNVYVPSSNNSLINGLNSYNCSKASNKTVPCDSNAPMSTFRFEKGKVHRLRLMNVGAAALVHFSIDNHAFQVIANDFVPLVPYQAEYITLGVGQRTDVLVNASGDADGAYWMRSTISLNCSAAETLYGKAVILYDQADDDAIPTSAISEVAAAADQKSFLCQNDPLTDTVPLVPQPAAAEADITTTLEIDLLTNSTGHHIWIMNNRTQIIDYSEPVLPLVHNGTDPNTLPPIWNVYDYDGKKDTTVRIILNNKYQSAHPMHIHGHDFQVLAEGPGYFDGTLTNLDNPLRRDTHMLRRYGHLVIQLTLDNPGVWNYHCHIAWHSSAGFNLLFAERKGEVAGANLLGMGEVLAPSSASWLGGNKVGAVEKPWTG